MEKRTIEITVQSNLCTGCGICKGICPKQCIDWKRQNGLFVPQIDASSCVHCGLCASVCPGLGHVYEAKKSALETVTGPVLQSVNAWSKDPQIRHVSASGGVITTLIHTLLKLGEYDTAFCVGSYDCGGQLKTVPFHADSAEFLGATPKSRYLPVSHENAVTYVKTHRKERVIFVGTPCTLRGFLSAVEKLGLNREQYLLIGLFCDRVFNYDFLTYLENRFCDGHPLQKLHFKNKESGGWPGNMKFFPEGGEPFFVSKDERQTAKDYFMPERCLYCVDKLNACADISLGDNYTGVDSSELGSNSVLIRTQRGRNAWDSSSRYLESHPVEIGLIHQAQSVTWRLNNLYYADLKSRKLKNGLDLNRNVPREENFRIFDQRWYENRKKILSGSSYAENPDHLEKQMKNDQRKSSTVETQIKRVYYLVKRNLW